MFMVKRKITQQQLGRIQKRLAVLQHDDQQELFDGLVILRYAHSAIIETTDGRLLCCAIRPAITSLVVGDKVLWQPQGVDAGVVVSCYPRQTLLSRWHAHKGEQAIAANVSQMLIVIASKPEISWILLDSYLIIADYLHITPIIILNKTDLNCDSIKERLLKIYAPLSYKILFTRYDENFTPEFLQTLLNQVSVIVGPSGVGKSSLITRLLPAYAEKIKIGALSELSELGCHTTFNAQYYHLPQGGAVIDSPGVRSMQLIKLPLIAIMQAYREFVPYLSKCRYRNCTHHSTPGCAIIEAMRTQCISAERYENYLKIIKLWCL